MTEESTSKDFFLSYNKADRAWAEWIAWYLEANGFTTIIQAWDFRPGSNFVLEMYKGASLAKRTIAVLSPDYLHSRFTQPEWAAAFAQDPTGEKGILLPIRVRSCELSGLLPQIIYIDLVDLEEAEAGTALLAGVRRTRAKPSSAPKFPGSSAQQPAAPAPRFPGTLPATWNVPYRRNPFFTGRDALLTHLHSQLHDQKTAALTQAHAISGLGGIGKTQSAVEYAYRYQDQYQAVLWATAATPLSLLADYVKLAALLQLAEQEARDQQETVAAVKRWLESHSEWLLILDNADDVRMVSDFLPLRGQGHILLTTRAQTIGTLGKSIEVEKMDQEEGMLLLLRRARVLDDTAALETVAPAEHKTAAAIVEAVGGLPLALDQAGAYIEETGCSLSGYLSLYQTRRHELLAQRKSLTNEHPEPVSTTWSLSFQRVEQANPAASDLLNLCAFLAPDAIAEELLSEGASELGEVLEPVAADPLKFNGALEVLRRYSLLKRNPKTKTLSIHRLVQVVLRDAMSDSEQRQWAERAVRAVYQVFPVADVETWARCERYLPHAQECLQLISHYDLEFSEAASLLHRVGNYLLDHARYAQAEQFYRRSLHIKEKTRPDHPSTATTLHELGRLSLEQGLYAQVEQFLQRALRIYEQTRPDHPHTAATLSVLGSLSLEQGLYAQAEQFYQRALRIKEKTRPDHPDTAATLSVLGSLFLEQGLYAQAEPFFQRALLIKEQTHPDHPNTAATLHELGRLSYQQGQYAQAEQFFLRTLRIVEKTLRPDHPSLIITLKSYAYLLRQMKRGEEAAILEKRIKDLSQS